MNEKFFRPATQRQILGFDGKPLTSKPKPVFVPGLRRNAADVALTSPEIRNPLLNIVNFFLPYNYKVLNQWIRYYDRFHPMVGNCIDLHGYFPISKFDLKLKKTDDDVLGVYEDCTEEIELFQRFLEMSREFELIGEEYPYLHWSDELNFFDAMILMNPDFINVKMHPLAYGMKPTIELEPDELLKSLVQSNEPEDIEIKQALDPVVVSAVMMGQNIRIDPFNTEQIARKASPYEPRGTSIVLRIIKDLLYEDKLRDAQYSVADGMITPKVLYKLGDPNNGYMPTTEDLMDFRALLQAQAHDPLAAIVTHYGLSLEYVGAYGKILPIVPEFQFIEDRILTGLYTNKALTHGEGPTFANATVAMEALQGRYMAKREKLEDFAIRKIYTPIALANEFYEPLTEAQMSHGVRPSSKDRKLNLPSFDWKQKLKLVDDIQRKQMIINLRSRSIPEVSLRKIYDELGIDFQTEMAALKEESKIMRQMKQDYGVENPLINPGSKPGGQAPKMPGMPGESGTTKPVQAPRDIMTVNSPGGSSKSSTPEPGGSSKTKEPGESLKGANERWNSELRQRASEERDKLLAALQDPPRFFSPDGQLKEVNALVSEAELKS